MSGSSDPCYGCELARINHSFLDYSRAVWVPDQSNYDMLVSRTSTHIAADAPRMAGTACLVLVFKLVAGYLAVRWKIRITCTG